jgi:hypothetical protein
MLVLLRDVIYEVRRWDGIMLHDIHAKFYEDWCMRQAILKFYMNNFRGCNVVVSDGKDLWCGPLRWAQVAWYTHQVS